MKPVYRRFKRQLTAEVTVATLKCYFEIALKNVKALVLKGLALFKRNEKPSGR